MVGEDLTTRPDAIGSRRFFYHRPNRRLYLDVRYGDENFWDLVFSDDAAIIVLDTTNFDKILGPTDSDLQVAMETLDDHIHAAEEITVDSTQFVNRLGITDDDVQRALETLDVHSHPLGDLEDVDVTGAGVGSLLVYNGASWVIGTGGSITVDHDDLLNKGVYRHVEIDAHIDDDTIHFTEGSISHLNILDIGVYTHLEIDAHIDNTSNPHSVTADQVGRTIAQWNAEWIQDFPVSTVDPVNNDILRYTDPPGEYQPYQLIVGAEYSCKAYLTADQTVTKNTWVALSFGATVWDTQSYWSIATPTRITIPAGQGGRYSIRTNCIWEQLTEDSSTQARIYINGVAVPASHSGQYVNKAAGGAVWLPTNNIIVFDVDLAAGDYIEFWVWCSVSTGPSVDALGSANPLYASWMSIERIE
jgi:hypothetical protein